MADDRRLPVATVVVPPTAAAGYDASEGRGPAHIVMGVVVDDPATGLLVRRVLRISMVMGALALISALMGLASGSTLNVVAQLLVLAIPACGYYGARNRSKDLLQWFWMSNACCVCLGVVSLVMTFGLTLPMVDCYCDPVCRAESMFNATDARLSPSTREQLQELDAICEDESGFHDALMFSALLSLLSMALQTAACVYGRRLADTELAASAPYGGSAVGSFARFQQPPASHASHAARGGVGAYDTPVGVAVGIPMGPVAAAGRDGGGDADVPVAGPLQRGTVVRVPGR